MKRGFTLSEMLILIVAILIIGATVAFFLDIFKKQASDSKRVTEIKQIARGLEEYYDKHAAYPPSLDYLVSEGILRYIPTPAPYGGTVKKYTYVPLGENVICTGYHLGAILETNHEGMLDKDDDARKGVSCVRGRSDFDGRAQNCDSSGSLSGQENCYDLKI